jgi:hypothetical protein
MALPPGRLPSLGTRGVESAEQSVDDRTGVQQVGERSQRLVRDPGFFRWLVQVGPDGGDQRARPIGQDEEEFELPVSMHPAQER